MSYTVYCYKLRQLLQYGKITERTYNQMISKKGKTPEEYKYIFESLQHGC